MRELMRSMAGLKAEAERLQPTSMAKRWRRRPRGSSWKPAPSCWHGARSRAQVEPRALESVRRQMALQLGNQLLEEGCRACASPGPAVEQLDGVSAFRRPATWHNARLR
jgi:hypothetical protein